MNAEFRTYTARLSLVLLTLVATVLGIMVTTMSLPSQEASQWSDGAMFAVIVAIMGAYLGGMLLVMLFVIRRRVVYTVSEQGIREEVHARWGRSRVRDVPWREVRSYRAYRHSFADVDFLRMATSQGKIVLSSAKNEEVEAAFRTFRDAAVHHLRASGVPEARPSAARRIATRTLGWALLAVVLAIPVYALAMPAEQRPDMWWLRWLVFVGLASPFVGGMLGGSRAPE